MFSEIVNYIVIPTLLSASALGVYYVWSPEDSKKTNIKYSLVWSKYVFACCYLL